MPAKKILGTKLLLSITICLAATCAKPARAKKLTLTAEVTATKSTPYRYTFAGSDYTTCSLSTKDDGQSYTQDCARGQAPTQEATHMGYTLRLELPDHRILDVTCTPGQWLWSGSPRDCSAPQNGAAVQIALNGEKAKLTWTAAAKTSKTKPADAKPAAITETYRVLHIEPPL